MADIADKFGKASIDTNYAVATTVKTTRVAGVTVLEAFDLSKFSDDTPVFFVTYKKTTDPVTGDVSVVDLVSWKGLVNVGANTLTNLTLAPGYVDGGNDIGDFIECIPTSYWVNSMMDGLFVGINPDGSFKKAAIQAALGNDGNLVQSLDDITTDFVVSGGVWAIVSGLNGGMTLLTAYIDGYKNTVSAVATRAFTVSKDTYVDVLRNTSTNAFTLVYTEVANGAASPALAANSLRLAKIVTSGVAIASVLQVSSDSLDNLIYPRVPGSRFVDANGWSVYNYIGYREYRKRTTYNQAFAGGTAIGFALNSSALPAGMSTLGNNLVHATLLQGGSAFVHQWNPEMSTGSTGLAATDVPYASGTFSGIIDWTIVNP